MQALRKVLLPLASLLFVGLLIPQSALAGTANCPAEPKSGVPIASGDVYAGANCTLNSTGDVDSFVFSAKSGDIWHFLVAGNNVAQFGINVCLSLYDPTATQVFFGCSTANSSEFAVRTDQTLTATGNYTMVVTEASNGALNYGVSLERDFPSPTDGQKVTLGKALTGSVSPGEDSPAFTVASVTTGTYQVSATIPNGVEFQDNLCMSVYSPTGASAGSGCTDTNISGFTFTVDFTPTQAGTYMALLYEDGVDGSGPVSYSLEISCLVGNCTPPPPSCSLSDALSYNATTSTLTMDFTVANNFATTWNAWLIYQNTAKKLFTAAQPITITPVAIAKTTSLPKEGEVGVLSTLTTGPKGIVCSSFVKLASGTP